MYYKALFALIQQAYSMILRDLLKEAINDPNKEWDDWTLQTIDRLFGYEK